MRGLLLSLALGLSGVLLTSVKAAEVEVSAGPVKVAFAAAGSGDHSLSRGYVVRVNSDIAVVIPITGGIRAYSFAGLHEQADLGRNGRTVTNLAGTGTSLSGRGEGSSATAIFRREGRFDKPAATWTGTFVMKLFPPPSDGLFIPDPLIGERDLLPYEGHGTRTLTVKATRNSQLTEVASKAQNLSEAIAAVRDAVIKHTAVSFEDRWGIATN